MEQQDCVLSWANRGSLLSNHIQSKLTVPRLKLCVAVLAVEIAEVIMEEIDNTLDSICFNTDSKVVLGYTHNQSRCFYV